MKVGEIVKIKGMDCVILDIQNDEVFLWTYVDVNTQFDYCINSYKDSLLEIKCDNWVEKIDLPFVEREIDLITMNGNKIYGSIQAKAAPLTFNEYQKYSEILEPHIKDGFWLATGWFRNHGVSCSAGDVCYIYNGGRLDYDDCTSNSGFAPAFKLPLSYFKEEEFLSKFSTSALIAELAKRFA